MSPHLSTPFPGSLLGSLLPPTWDTESISSPPLRLTAQQSSSKSLSAAAVQGLPTHLVAKNTAVCLLGVECVARSGGGCVLSLLGKWQIPDLSELGIGH